MLDCVLREMPAWTTADDGTYHTIVSADKFADEGLIRFHQAVEQQQQHSRNEKEHVLTKNNRNSSL